MKFVLQSSVLDLKTILLDMANGAIDVVPKLLMAIVILIVGTIVAKIVTKVTKRALVIAKVDKLGDSLNNVDIVHKANNSFRHAGGYRPDQRHTLISTQLACRTDSDDTRYLIG